jgi:hypothetical protein
MLQLYDSTPSQLQRIFHTMTQTLVLTPVSQGKYTANLALTARMVLMTTKKLRTRLLTKKMFPAQPMPIVNDHSLYDWAQQPAQIQLQMSHNQPPARQRHYRGALPSRQSHLFHQPSGRSDGFLRRDLIWTLAFRLWKTFQIMCMRLRPVVARWKNSKFVRWIWLGL